MHRLHFEMAFYTSSPSSLLHLSPTLAYYHRPTLTGASAISCFAHLASPIPILSLLPNKPWMWEWRNCLQKQAGKKRVLSIVAAGALQEVANTEIPTRDGTKIQAFVSIPPSKPTSESQSAPEKLALLILIHEFYGLTPEICGKAEAIAKEVGCVVIAPDTYRGDSTRFVPKAIFLALTTPQERVNKDLDDVLAWASTLPQVNIDQVGVAGFCYGGGKALEYSIYYKKAKAVIVIYGKPVLDVESLKSISGSVLGVFGDQDAQFPLKTVMEFEEALEKAGIRKKIIICKGQGHAFWKDMDQIVRGSQPQKEVWIEVTNFLKDTLLT